MGVISTRIPRTAVSIARGLILGALIALLPTAGFGEHPIEVQQLASNSEYYKALVTFDRIPRRQATTESTIAAGRSAWALSLPDRATALFDEALKDTTLPAAERARVLLSKGIIEYQENRHQVAALYAERAMKLLESPSPLRAKVWALHGQTLAALKNYGAAEDKLVNAIAESEPTEAAELHFQLGEVRLKLNKLEDARLDFESIPMGNDRIPQAMRYLGEIALQTGKMSQVSFWLNRGRSEYPDSFLDSWVDYALAEAAIGSDDLEELRRIRIEANQKFAPSDYWITLMNAAAEAFEWRTEHGIEQKEHDESIG